MCHSFPAGLIFGILRIGLFVQASVFLLCVSDFPSTLSVCLLVCIFSRNAVFA